VARVVRERVWGENGVDLHSFGPPRARLLVRLPGNQAACEHRQMQLSTTFDLEDEIDEDAA
jgi:hypothetical protein